MEISVKQPNLGKAGQEFLPVANMPQGELPVSNGQHAEPEHLATILQSLQTMKNGDFSVRLPVSWTGLAGKIADNFNEIVIANEQMAFELKRVGQAVGKEGKTRERIRVEQRRGAWDDMEVSVNTLVEDLLRPTAEVTRAIAAVAQGNLTQTVRLDVDGRPLEGEFLRSARIVNTMIQQLGVFHSRGNARSPRSWHRRKTRWPGAGAWRGRHVERLDRLSELHGQQPDRPGEKHR